MQTPNNRNLYLSHVAVAAIFVAATALACAFPAHAQVFDNPLGKIEMQVFLEMILKAVILILFPIIVLMVVYTGFLFVSAQGDPTKLATAKRMFVWTVVGAIIVLGAQMLSFAVRATVDDIMVGTFG